MQRVLTQEEMDGYIFQFLDAVSESIQDDFVLNGVSEEDKNYFLTYIRVEYLISYSDIDVDVEAERLLNKSIEVMRVGGLIRQFCKGTEDCRIYEEFSGKSMGSRKCLGIRISSECSQEDVVNQLREYLHKKGIENIAEVLGKVCTVFSGYHSIVYFPSIC